MVVGGVRLTARLHADLVRRFDQLRSPFVRLDGRRCFTIMPDANGSSASAGPAQSSSKAPAFKGAPISGVFAIDKPSGPSSASLLEQLKPLFSHSVLFRDPHAKKQFNGGGGGKKARMEAKYKKEKGISLLAQIKMGHGGTLDPLASGVLVIGINNGTKAMGSYQSNSKKGYDATVLLGCETDSYDAKGKVVGFKEWRHVDRQMVEDACVSLRGEGTQIPPLFVVFLALTSSLLTG